MIDTTTLQMAEGFRCMGVFPDCNFSLVSKIGAEFVGTFIMIFTAAAAPIANQNYHNEPAAMIIWNAAAAGLSVMAVILSTGHISGAHLNPAVTVAFATQRHFPWAQVLPYIAIQVSASISASFALKEVFDPFMPGGVTVPTISNGKAFTFEFIATFILMFVNIAMADKRAVRELAALAVGGTVLLNNLVAGPATGASMNPVRTWGPAIAAGNYNGLWIYMVSPPLGALAGPATYNAVKILNRPPNQVHDDYNGQDDTAASYVPLSPALELRKTSSHRNRQHQSKIKYLPISTKQSSNVLRSQHPCDRSVGATE